MEGLCDGLRESSRSRAELMLVGLFLIKYESYDTGLGLGLAFPPSPSSSVLYYYPHHPQPKPPTPYLLPSHPLLPFSSPA
jgi:hypothetical protein